MNKVLDFLAQRRIAIAGVSHIPNDFSRMLFREFRKREYEVIPVNPAWPEIEGAQCYPRMQDIPLPIGGALLMTAPAVTDEVVKDCEAAGIRRVWMYRRSPAAVAFCEAHDISVIAGECPLMYLSDTGWIHRFHGWLHSLRAA